MGAEYLWFSLMFGRRKPKGTLHPPKQPPQPHPHPTASPSLPLDPPLEHPPLNIIRQEICMIAAIRTMISISYIMYTSQNRTLILGMSLKLLQRWVGGGMGGTRWKAHLWVHTFGRSCSFGTHTRFVPTLPSLHPK